MQKNKCKPIDIGRSIVFEHCEVVRRNREDGKIAVGVVVAPFMDTFSPGAFEAAETAEDLMLLSDRHDVPFYILNVCLDRL
ncbi:28748_t:CDS:1, partial [Racocetra persica]